MRPGRGTRGVVLFGPPASGKDTVTDALNQMDPQFVPFRKLKVGEGNWRGYRRTTSDELNRLASAGRLISVVRRYGNTYAVDSDELNALESRNLVPLIHTTDLTELAVLTQRPGWRSVLLWTPLRTARTRLLARSHSDVGERLDLRSLTLRALGWEPPPFDSIVDTSQVPAPETARVLVRHGFRVPPSLTLADVLADPDLVVPVVTIFNPDGTVDWDRNVAYARATAPSGVSVLVAGTTGSGQAINNRDALALGQIWCDELGPGRVTVGLLSKNPDVSSLSTGVRPLAIPLSGAPLDLSELAARIPEVVAYCKPSLGSGLSPRLGQWPSGVRPFALKVSGLTAMETAGLMNSGDVVPRIWHGHSRDAAEAWRRGADAVVLAPLAAAVVGQELPRSWSEIFALSANIAARLGSGRDRISNLRREVVRRITKAEQ